jgi:hypothetical protein
MKCSSCNALNAPSDIVCAACQKPLYLTATGLAAATIPVPGWAYVFGALCIIIPVVALGGLVSVLLGLGGASSCVKVSSWGALPGAVRFLLCFFITAGCWFLFAALVAGIAAAKLKHR